MTDGVTEARNAKGQLFGDDGVRGVLEGVSSEDSLAIVDRLEEAVMTFAGGRVRDDIAIVAMRWDA
jgi:serine phosphatase RsbU (regulator of sigma subunit)